jgi:hypothetical protein
MSNLENQTKKEISEKLAQEAITFRNLKCKDRVSKSYHSRMNDIKTLFNSEDQETEELGSLGDYGLSIDYVTKGTFSDQRKGYFRYQLSWGGPSEEFRYYVQNDKLEFWLLDWFDGAKVTITSETNKEIIKEILGWKFEDLKETAAKEEQEALEENY